MTSYLPVDFIDRVKTWDYASSLKNCSAPIVNNMYLFYKNQRNSRIPYRSMVDILVLHKSDVILVICSTRAIRNAET